MRFPRMLGVYMDDSASSLYRIIRPMKALQDAGFPAGYAHVDSVDDRMLSLYDAVVVLRTGNGDPQRIRAALQLAKQQCKVVWLDYDDDVLHVPDHNPGRPTGIDGVLASLDEAHGVVVTNRVLASVFRPYAKQLAIIPNYIDPQSWPTKTPRYSPKLTVGITGTASHGKDWEIIAEPMRRIRQRHDVEFLVGGFLPSYLEDSVSIFVDWLPLDQYPYMVNSIDIALCPLRDDAFNRGKTPIKALEAGLAGAAVVASPTQYADVVRGKGTIARTEAEWEAAIEKYIVDDHKRRIAQVMLRVYVEKRWDVYRHVDSLVEGYKALYYRCIGPMTKARAA